MTNFIFLPLHELFWVHPFIIFNGYLWPRSQGTFEPRSEVLKIFECVGTNPAAGNKIQMQNAKSSLPWCVLCTFKKILITGKEANDYFSLRMEQGNCP